MWNFKITDFKMWGKKARALAAVAPSPSKSATVTEVPTGLYFLHLGLNFRHQSWTFVGTLSTKVGILKWSAPRDSF